MTILTRWDRTRKRVWPQVYKAALFELDTNKVSDRIAEAEAALVTRARELFHSAEDNIEEEQAVDDAMYALHALRSALKVSV
jgi:HPt (histidine-containing phosphotransfer) domain-containing protein